jgi:hypothetical protein
METETMGTIEEFLADPTAPYWAKDVVRVAMGKDPVDAAKWLRFVSQLIAERTDEILARDRE